MNASGKDDQAPLADGFPPVDQILMTCLQGLYEAHGANAHWVDDDDWIVVDGGKLRARASWEKYSEHSGQGVVQADFFTVLSSGEVIVESFIGMGIDLVHALKDACANFSATLHVLVAAVLNKSCSHAVQERWLIDGKERAVTLGMPQCRGSLPAGAWPSVFHAIQSQIKHCPVPAGLHWMRYYHGHFLNQPAVIEVLLDNELNVAMQKEASYFPWPASDTFYSARLFLIIQDL